MSSHAAHVRKLKTHINEVAQAFNVKIHWVPALLAQHDADTGEFIQFIAGAFISGASPDEKFVQLARVVDEPTYAIALHELGHLLAPGGNYHEELLYIVKRLDRYPLPLELEHQLVRRFMSLRHDQEEHAWTWARHHALLWTPMMEATMAMGVDSHENTYEIMRQMNPQIKWRPKGGV